MLLVKLSQALELSRAMMKLLCIHSSIIVIINCYELSTIPSRWVTISLMFYSLLNFVLWEHDFFLKKWKNTKYMKIVNMRMQNNFWRKKICLRTNKNKLLNPHEHKQKKLTCKICLRKEHKYFFILDAQSFEMFMRNKILLLIASLNKNVSSSFK
jgi:hypothetical protein